MSNIDRFVGHLTPDELPDLLERAWEAMTEDQRMDFVKSHRTAVEEIIENLAE